MTAPNHSAPDHAPDCPAKTEPTPPHLVALDVELTQARLEADLITFSMRGIPWGATEHTALCQRASAASRRIREIYAARTEAWIAYYRTQA